MRNLFLAMLAALISFTQYMDWRFARNNPPSGVPVIYWVTDPNPARVEQVALFKAWMKKRGYPEVDLRVDVNNGGLQKTVVQGVTGVAGDCIDAPSLFMSYLYSIGIILPVTNLAARFGYPDSGLFPAIYNDIVVDGKQVAFPCNIVTSGYLVNADTFTRVGMEPPPFMMDFETFERIGMEFTAKANRGLPRREYFFARSLDDENMRRSCGVANFNETLTRSAVNRPEWLKVLKLIYRWTYTNRLVPTLADIQSFASEHGYGGLEFQLLNKGYFGMVSTGRYAMIQMREMKARPQWRAVLPPHGGYPIALAQTRAVVLYAGSPNIEAATYFLGFLRSDEYSMHVVRDSDSLPPNPKFMDTEEYRRPAGHTNEWAMHEGFRRIAMDYGTTREMSPFALFRKYNRIEGLAFSGYMNDLHTAEEAVAMFDQAINEEVDRYVKSHPEIRARYAKALENQKIIDAAKAAGKKIPLALVDNSFLRRFYQERGLGE
ncbi:MAG: carbohydrate ABC transporter substrate-binding protein [Spirochaetes bacterium]|nr:carbohydrate ABC transporter substrate-binding protein [Spirochaetota bacterium]